MLVCYQLRCRTEALCVLLRLLPLVAAPKQGCQELLSLVSWGLTAPYVTAPCVHRWRTYRAALRSWWAARRGRVWRSCQPMCSRSCSRVRRWRSPPSLSCSGCAGVAQPRLQHAHELAPHSGMLCIAVALPLALGRCAPAYSKTVLAWTGSRTSRKLCKLCCWPCDHAG